MEHASAIAIRQGAPGLKEVAAAGLSFSGDPGPLVPCKTLYVSLNGTDVSKVRSGAVKPPEGEGALILGKQAAMERLDHPGVFVTIPTRQPCDGFAGCPAASFCDRGLFRSTGSTRRHGALQAAVLLIPERLLVELPVTEEQVRHAIWAQSLADACKAVEQAVRLRRALAEDFLTRPCRPSGAGSTSVVFGAGKTGLALAAVLAPLGPVCAVDRAPAGSLRAAVARRLGADYLQHEMGRAALPAAQADLVFDTTGAAEAIPAAFRLARHCGCVVWFGFPQGREPVDTAFHGEQIDKQIVSVGCVGHEPRHVREAAGLLPRFIGLTGDLLDQGTTVLPWSSLSPARLELALTSPGPLSVTVAMAR
ncbi:MAG: zinc-binding dehydrogenase [Armatimonadetes bacterium]|nr:zinc-binding dehydrogenase [Armatimonadota bacterium]